MKKIKKVLAFVLAIGLMLSLLPPNITLRAEESVATSITLQADDTRIHRSNVNNPSNDGVKAYTSDNGLAGNINNMTYDATNANRLAKVCIYNLKKLMTEPIGTSSDKGIGRYPYVVTKIDVKESGYYNIGTQINMRADGQSNTMVIMVDGVMHIVKTTLGSIAKQTVWKNNLYLSEGDHTVLYMAPIPQNVSDCPETADKYYYPWTNFWSFTFEKGSNNQSNTDINDALEILDASTLTGTDVENMFKESTCIEAEDTKYVAKNIYSSTEENANASGGYFVGGGAYTKCKQTLEEIKTDGLKKDQMPYLQYMVNAPADGEYYITIRAYVGTGNDASTTNIDNPVPYIAVVANDNDPIEAQFDGAWNAYDSVTVPVQLKEGINTIYCTGIVKGQYADGSSAWVNFDSFEIQKGLTARPIVVSATDDDNGDYLKFAGGYTDSGSNFGGPAYTELREDFPSLYEDMLGIYSTADTGKADRWPYIAFTVDAAQDGYYEISASTDGKGSGDTPATTVGMIVDGATYVVNIDGSTLSKSVYLSAGKHVIIFTSPIYRDMESRPSEKGTNKQYVYMNYKSFTLSEGLGFVKEEDGTEADVVTAMTNYSRIEAEDFSYATINGNYNADIVKDYVRKYNSPYTVKVKGIEGAEIDGEVSDLEKQVNAAQTYADIKDNGLNAETSYVQHIVIADKAGSYMIRVGAYVEGSGTMPYGTILVNGEPYKAQFSGNWNGYDAVNILVDLEEGKNTIQCIGVTADQTETNGWIGYDFIDVPKGITTERKVISATDDDNGDYLKFAGGYTDSGSEFGGPSYSELRKDFPSLYEDMLGIYSDEKTDRADKWPYIAFTVDAEKAGEYQITANVSTDGNRYQLDTAAKTVGMIVDGAMYVIDVPSANAVLSKSVYLTKGKHVIIFTSPIFRDMESRPEAQGTNEEYLWMNYKSFKISAGLSFVKEEDGTEADVETAMTTFSRLESEDFSYTTTKGNYNADIVKDYVRKYNSPYTVKVKGIEGATIDGIVSDLEKTVNATQTYADIKDNGLNAEASYVQHIVIADEAGQYMIRVGAYVEGSGTMPYGTILVNGKPYKAQFSGNWNGYDAVNLWVDLEEGENIIQCVGVTADQTGTDGWIGYDFIEIPTGVHTERKEVSASDDDCDNYVYLNRYEDKGANFGDPGSNTIYPDMRYDYPSLYEDMLGIYSAANTTKANRWPYVALKVNAEQAGTYEISTKIGTKNTAETIGMIVDGAMYVIDVTTTSGYLTKSVYLTEGKHVIIFTSPMPRDLEGALTQNNDAYPYMDFVSFKVSADLNFVDAPTETDIQNAMKEYARVEVEDFTSESVNGNYNADISKKYVRRYNSSYIVEVKGANGAVIDGEVSDTELIVNTTQTYEDIKANGLKPETSYVEQTVIATETGTYMIRVGAYVEGSGTMPYGTILVNNIPYKVQFSGNWNGYDAVTIPVELVSGKNTIKLVGVTADQTGTTGWIGYDFVDVSRGIVIERSTIKATDTDWDRYLYLNRYKDSGTSFGGPNYDDMRYDFPSLYEEMLGIYSNMKPDRAGYWPYIAFKVYAEEAGNYELSTKIQMAADSATIGMIVDGATHVVDVTTKNGYLSKSVYLTEGEHVIIFTSPIYRDMESRPATTGTSAQYPYMNFASFKLSDGLLFGGLPTDADIQTAMTKYVRIEAEDVAYASKKGNYNAVISKTYKSRFGTSIVNDNVKIIGFEGAAIDGIVSDAEKKVNASQTSYVEYKVTADEAGTYTIRVGAYLEGSGTMPYGTIKVNGKVYKAQFSGNWNGYDVVNLPVELKKGENTIQCIGVTAEQIGTNGWIGYDFIDVPSSCSFHEDGEYTNTSVESGLDFERRVTYETDGTILGEPYTVSAWIYLPSGYPSRGGVIFGNYIDNETPCANFEIDVNGAPKFLHINEEGKKVEFTFNEVNVCADEWTNITFTISGNTVSCYRNGVFVASRTSKDVDIDLESVKNQYLLGGDLRPTTEEGSPNARYFRGRIIDLALYDTALSNTEVRSVYKAEAIDTKPYTRYKLENAEKDKNIVDIMGNNSLDVKLPYFEEKEEVTDYAYSFAVVGDTQIVTENDVKKGEDNLSKIYDWILKNQTSKKIQFVLGLGDITDNNNMAEWAHALSQISKLDGKLPYSLVRGNHDLIGSFSAEDKTADYMTDYLGTEAYRNMVKETGGFYKEDNIASSWQTLTAGNVQYLILALDFGSNDGVIEWANDIIEKHPNHQVIITTHAYLYRDGTTLDAGDTAPPSGYNKKDTPENEKYRDGDYVWDNLVSKHKNIVLVLSGHDPSDNIIVSRDKGDNGNIVTSMLIDPQGVDSDTGSNGMLAMLYFTEDGSKVQVEYLSTVTGEYFKEINQFTIELFNEEVSAADKDWDNYLYLNSYQDKGAFFGGPNYDHMRWDYPSLYEEMFGIYSDEKTDRANYWPYIAFTVNAEKAGEYQISANIGTNRRAETIGMIVDGAMHVVDVTTKKGDLTGSVYLTEGEHVVIFTSPIPRDMESRPTTTGTNAEYPYMDYNTFKLSAGLSFGEKPTDADIQAAMTEYTRIEAESISYATTNGNYNTDISKNYSSRYGSGDIKVIGIKGAKIDGSVSASEKKVNTTQTFKEISKKLDAKKTPYVQYKVQAEKAGSYTIRVGAYLEGSGTIPYGTILVNGKAYKAQFTGNWNGYDAVNLTVELEKGENTIQCIGVTADQKDTKGWIGYDFIDVSRGITTEHKEVSASDKDWNKYLKLNMYLDNGDIFGVGNGDDGLSNYGHIRYDYPSLYEAMLGIYSDEKTDRAGSWPYIAFTVEAEKAGEYLISAEISTNENADTIGMIVDGAMYVVDVTTTKGDLTESVYLSKGKHVIIFTSPMPRDMEGALKQDDTKYPWLDFKAVKLDANLDFGKQPTDTDIKSAMTTYTRLEAESVSYVITNGNYNTEISKDYTRRYSTENVKIIGFKGAKIDGKASASEKKVNTTQTFKEISKKLDAKKTPYVQYKVQAEKSGSYVIRVGAYLEGSGTMPYGTILVNGKAYKAQFTGNWNGYDAVNLTVDLEKGENIIQCIGVTADQKDTKGWIGYDFIDVSNVTGMEYKEVSASDKDWKNYLTLNMYLDNGNMFGVGNGEDGFSNYGHIRWDYPSLYGDMAGIYSDENPDRANWWPYIAFTVYAERAGEYPITAKVGTTDAAETVGMIVDGAMYVATVNEQSEVTKNVYLSKGKHVIIFTSPMPRDMEGALSQDNAKYPWMDYYSFKLGVGLSFVKAPTEASVEAAMTSYTRIEAEDVVYATYNSNYGADITKKYSIRYNPLTTIMGANGAVIDGKVTAKEKEANTSQTYAQLSKKLDAKATSYVEYSINAKEAGTYMIRIGAYIEGSKTMPYGTVLVNGKAYKVQFSGNMNGYDAVNLPVELQKGANTIQCVGVTADQKDTNAWIGYDYLDIQSGLSANKAGATQINAGDEKYVTFNKYEDKGDTLGGALYDDMRWDRMSLDILNYAYLSRMPYAAVKVTAASDGTYDVYFKSQYNTAAESQQIGVLVDGVTTYVMTLSEFRSHVAIPLTAGTHTLVFTTPMPADMETASKTEKMDREAYPWMDMNTIILGKGLTVEKAPDKNQLEKPYTSVEAETYALPNLAKITENGVGSGLYLKAQTADEIMKNGIDATVTPFVQYSINASEAGEYTLYVALKSGMAATMTAEVKYCNIVIENGDERQVKNFYSHLDTQGVGRVIPVTVTLEKGMNEVRITHITGDSIQDKGYVWNDFDYIEMSPETAEKLTFVPTTVLEAEDASYMSYTEKVSENMSGEAYLANADYGYIDENQITFEALDVENLDDLPRVTYTFEAEKAGTYTLAVKFNTGLINYKLEDLEKIGFAVIVNGKDKQLLEYEMGTLDASTTRAITVDLVEGENEITFTSTLADYMNAVSPRIEEDYRLVWVDHDAVYLSYGLSSGKEAEKFSVESSSVGHSQLELLAGSGDNDGSGVTAKDLVAVGLGVVAVAAVSTPLVLFIRRRYPKFFKKHK